MDRERHLAEERISISLVDGGWLTQEEKDHLDTCPECAGRRDRLLSSLAALSQTARRHTPAPPRRVVLPAEAPLNPMAWLMRWSMGLAFALAGVLIVAVYIMGQFHGRGPGFPDAAEADRDALLLAQVRSLEDDPLPRAYKYIIPEVDLRLDEEFFDFLIPDENPARGRTRT